MHIELLQYAKNIKLERSFREEAAVLHKLPEMSISDCYSGGQLAQAICTFIVLQRSKGIDM